VLGRADTIRPGNYELACVMALAGLPEDARSCLFRCWAYQTLPSIEALEVNPYLQTVQTEPWFNHIRELARGGFADIRALASRC
jgi:hypothetical protein